VAERRPDQLTTEVKFYIVFAQVNRSPCVEHSNSFHRRTRKAKFDRTQHIRIIPRITGGNANKILVLTLLNGSEFRARVENPYRLVSLLDMLRFYAEKVARSSSLLGQIFVEIRSGIVPKDSSWGLVGSELRELEKLCAEMGLAVTLAQINRVNQMVADDSFGRNLPFFGQQLIEIQTRLNDELA
jgi:hypothetical protein